MIFSSLKELGVLGINDRIGRYILRCNKRKNYPLVDNKVLTFKKAKEWAIPMPENYEVVERFGDLRKIEAKLSKLDSFVIKPAQGSQGNGIIVIQKVEREAQTIRYYKSGDKEVSIDEIKHHISSILSGLYSLSGQPDNAIIQEKISMHPVFENYCYQGIPDVRVIVYNGFPVMSMLRLPTKSSGGRANLHQGAIGAGVSIKTGQTVNAVINNQVIKEHPDTHYPVEKLNMPCWQEILELSSRCYDMVNLGYLGVDLVVTEKQGPILLELNARPGLAIQIANMSGLVPRLKQIGDLQAKNMSLKQRVQLSREYFN